MKAKSLSRVQRLATPLTAAYQAPPSMGFSRQEYWSGVPLSSLIFLEHKYKNSQHNVGKLKTISKVYIITKEIYSRYKKTYSTLKNHTN